MMKDMKDGELNAEDLNAELLATIVEYGWAARLIKAGKYPDEPPFAYSVGLTAMGHPELVIVGMSLEAAHQFMIQAVDLIKTGHRFEPGTLTTALTEPDSPFAVIKVEETAELTGVQWVYGRVEAVQLIWPDSKGHLPWQAGYNNPSEAQQFWGPLPDEWQSG